MINTGGETATEVWERIHMTKGWGVWPSTRFVEWAMRRYRAKPETRFLELGSGAGAQLRFLREEGFKAMGIELSSYAATKSTYALQVPTMIGDVRNLTALVEEYDAGPFDCIFDVCTLQHLAIGDALDVIRQAQELLPKGGTIWSMMAAPGYSIDWMSDVPAPRLASPRDTFAIFGPDHKVIGTEIVSVGMVTSAHWLIEWVKP